MNKIKEIVNKEHITGKEILEDLELHTGCIYKCTGVPDTFGEEGIDNYVLITDSEECPIISLEDGILWDGEVIDKCTFKLIQTSIQIN